MTTREALCAMLAAIMMLTAGFVWMFGPFGLLGGGVAVIALTLFTDEREDDDG